MKNISMRDAFFDRLYELAKKDKNIILISADMGAPSLDKYRKALAKQFVNVGIAEANMVTVAAGLALNGKKIYIYAIMPFVTSRCYEMLKVDASLMNLSITAVGVGAGFSYDDSGPTHHSTEDIALMRTLPNITVFSTSDSVMAESVADISYETKGPSYVRLDREVLPQIYDKKDNFSSGLKRLKAGKDVCVISTGNMVHIAFEICRKLKKDNIKAGVIDLHRLKPVNIKLLLEEINAADKIVTLEEHLVSGGLGSIVAEIIIDNLGKAVPFRRFGVMDKYHYAYGGRKNIQSICGIDADCVAKKISHWLHKEA